MDKKEYIQKSNAIIEKMIRLEKEISTLMYDYYKASPKEKGKKNTDFYKEISGVLDTYERGVYALRDKLSDPDSIEVGDTR